MECASSRGRTEGAERARPQRTCEVSDQGLGPDPGSDVHRDLLDRVVGGAYQDEVGIDRGHAVECKDLSVESPGGEVCRLGGTRRDAHDLVSRVPEERRDGDTDPARTDEGYPHGVSLGQHSRHEVGTSLARIEPEDP
jgi:hypothetical protein